MGYISKIKNVIKRDLQKDRFVDGEKIVFIQMKNIIKLLPALNPHISFFLDGIKI